MSYHTLHFVPVHAPDADLPDSPDLAPFAARKDAAKRTFLRQLVDHADEPFVGMQWDVPEMGRILIQMDIVQHTAALVTIGRYAEPPAECTLAMTLVLLSGLADGDDAALDLVKTTPGFCNNPHLGVEAYDAARDSARRPLMVQCFVDPKTYTNPHLRTLVEALADAFFDQFGTGSEEDEKADECEDGEDGEDGRAEAA
jgi:hypothetical protein